MAGPPPRPPPCKLTDKSLIHWLSSYNTVVYYSTGTVFVPSESQIDVLREVFRVLGERGVGVIWCYDGYIGGLSPNVRVVDWVSQVDLLGSGEVDLFVTHGGINSVFEAIRARVPLLVTPYFFDQPQYASVVEREGLGKRIQLGEWTVDKFLESIEELLEDGSYRQRIEAVDSMLRRLYNSTQAFDYWVDFTLNFDTSSMCFNHHEDMYWFQRWGLD
eukprot:CAMPEP_0114974190 /NCGR_PEP_ID=MMETSP0216-20121206/1382_1 /TAXON_ID=223996 /ORGANISM="Protocruzia adherens, Strain Boccale" /LENGTH=216 /DNA_ID=CAMNT_0002334785 /DNA_START=693 /DNA_END=1340 /DNA_ORIENTATION=-